jgi:hypothetical protein
MVPLASFGCAEAWLWLGSIDLNLERARVSLASSHQIDQSFVILSAQEVSEICDGVAGVPDEEVLRLRTAVLLAVDV